SERSDLPLIGSVRATPHHRLAAHRTASSKRKERVAMDALIEARGLTKTFGKNTRALDGLDLSVPAGQTVAILGPNGAGKTTFIRTVATLLRPDAGALHVASHDVTKEP